VTTVATYVVTVYMAGDIDTAKRWLRRHCYDRGLCVTVAPTSFIYTGGEETGFSVGLVNYPRFPSEPADIFDHAESIARSLVAECCQTAALVVATDRTRWIKVQPPGASRDS
jgi:Fe-S-cluster-containing hydrogenase component 2